MLFLSFGNYLDRPTTEEIGQIIAEELRAVGLDVLWNRSAETKIAIENFEWDNYYIKRSITEEGNTNQQADDLPDDGRFGAFYGSSPCINRKPWKKRQRGIRRCRSRKPAGILQTISAYKRNRVDETFLLWKRVYRVDRAAG